MLDFPNVGAFCHGLDVWMDEVELLADATLRGLAVQAFNTILAATPEWSGNLAGAWTLTVGARSTGYTETPFKSSLDLPTWEDSKFSRRTPNQAALAYARAISRGEEMAIHVNTVVHITNNTPYAELVSQDRNEKGRPFLRTVNLPVEMLEMASDGFNREGLITEGRALVLAAGRL